MITALTNTKKSDYPTIALFEINGEITKWGIGNPEKIPGILREFEKRGHRIKLIRALTNLHQIDASTKSNTTLRWIP